MTQAQQVQKRPFPRVGEVFELTASEELTGLGLVEAFWYDPSSSESERWESTDPAIPAETTSRFKLVRVSHSSSNIRPMSFEEVLWKLQSPGQKVPEGAWLKVFCDTFSQTKGFVVGVASEGCFYEGVMWHPYIHHGRGGLWASKISPSGVDLSPATNPYGDTEFVPTGMFRYNEWLWLVEVDEK